MPDDAAYLLDMLTASREAVAFVGGATWEEFSSNRMMQIAVLYAVQTIGEAATHVSPVTQRAHPEIPWHQIIGMRHRLVRAYRDIDASIVWDITQNDLPALVMLLEPLVPREDT